MKKQKEPKQTLVIQGGYPLQGTVAISGAKNAALPILVATLLTDAECRIENVPDLQDVRTTCALLEHLGKKVIRQNDCVVVYPSDKYRTNAPYALVSKMRASVLVAGPLLARYGKACVALPGGCAIGSRPINFHLQGFKLLGARVEVKKGFIYLRKKNNFRQTMQENKERLILFDYPSVGATENLLMAATLTPGRTILENISREPEVTDLANFLKKLGARISGSGASRMVIQGVERLGGCTRYPIIPDRIEAGTFLIAGAVTKGMVRLEKVIPEHLSALLEKMEESGLLIEREDTAVTGRWVIPLRPVDIQTYPYPGFPTDLQAPWMSLMCVTAGRSVITETVFENRFLHVGELVRLGASIRTSGNTAVIDGVEHLEGTAVQAMDLRGGAALVLAGLATPGKTIIRGIEHLDRGYDQMEAKFRNLGAKINRLSLVVPAKTSSGKFII